jgi:hypothetical protein
MKVITPMHNGMCLGVCIIKYILKYNLNTFKITNSKGGSDANRKFQGGVWCILGLKSQIPGGV